MKSMRPSIDSRTLTAVVLLWTVLIFLSLTLQHNAQGASAETPEEQCLNRDLNIGNLKISGQDRPGLDSSICQLKFSARTQQKVKAIAATVDCQQLAQEITQLHSQGANLKTLIQKIDEFNACEEKVSAARQQVELDSVIPVREFRVNSDGRFEVFTQKSDVDFSTSRSKVYYFFPRKNSVAVTSSNGQNTKIRLSTGDMLDIASNGEITRFAEIDETALTALNTSFDTFPGIVLSNGLALEIPMTGGREVFILIPDERKRIPAHSTAIFRDSSGRECQLKTGELFEFAGIGPEFGSPVEKATQFYGYLRFRTDRQLKEFLEPRCPGLDLRVLASQ